MAACTASVLCVKAALGGIDNPDTFSRGPAPGACRFVEPPAASEALVSGVYPRTDGNSILDVVTAPADGAEGACVVPVVIGWAGGCRSSIGSAHTKIPSALHGVNLFQSGIFQHFKLPYCAFSRSESVACPVAYIDVYAAGGLKIPMGISWYHAGKIKTM